MAPEFALAVEGKVGLTPRTPRAAFLCSACLQYPNKAEVWRLGPTSARPVLREEEGLACPGEVALVHKSCSGLEFLADLSYQKASSLLVLNTLWVVSL